MLNQLVSAGIALILVYVTYKFFYSSPDVESGKPEFLAAAADPDNERDVVDIMAANNKRVIVFYGSQTGTAEDLATKLSKELSSRFGLKTMTADLDNFDYDTLDKFPAESLAVFLMASYGEGEPTDNAQDFMSFITGSPEFSEGASDLPNMQFAVFGLGNSSYELYNQVGRDLYKVLTQLSAEPVVAYGEGDDGTGTLEEDFMAWKDEFFDALVQKWSLTPREMAYEPSLLVQEIDAPPSDVYLGEPNMKHLLASKQGAEPQGPYTSSNPLLARVTHARELFRHAGTQLEERHCVHLELDVTGLKYTTGDHLAVWAQNSEVEITRFLRALGLEAKRDQVIALKVLDSTQKLHVPSPTSYDTVVRFYLEVNGPVSRQVLASFAAFAPTPQAKAACQRLASSKELFHTDVVEKCYNLARLLLELSDGEPWTAVPFNFVVETVPHLVPRYYSISSSSLETPNAVTITAVVECMKPKSANHEVFGVVTNNLLSIERATNGFSTATYSLERPHRGPRLDGSIRLPVHVRHSLFKLPRKTSLPIIMIGSGTGVAPFRGFIHERALQRAQGKEVGPALLFYGARHAHTEYLYGDEWAQHAAWLQVETAFSRDGAQKVYVQDRLRERAADVDRLIADGASIYVCGDASHMARDVHETLLNIIATQRGVSHDDADRVLRKLRSRNKYLEDVW